MFPLHTDSKSRRIIHGNLWKRFSDALRWSFTSMTSYSMTSIVLPIMFNGEGSNALLCHTRTCYLYISKCKSRLGFQKQDFLDVEGITKQRYQDEINNIPRGDGWSPWKHAWLLREHRRWRRHWKWAWSYDHPSRKRLWGYGNEEATLNN